MIVLLKSHPVQQAMSTAARPADMVDGDVRRNPGEPSPEQAEADTYKKPRVQWRGLTIAIENPAGSVRRGTNRHGVSWEIRMRYDYGEVVGSMGVDGDPVDIYLGPALEDAPMVYVVHQRKVGRWDEYDEDKCMAGFLTEEDAKQAFLSNYNDPRFLGPVTAMPVDEFVAKVRATREKPAMIKALFLKTHVDTYTRKDGVVVQAHEDKRHATHEVVEVRYGKDDRYRRWEVHHKGKAVGHYEPSIARKDVLAHHFNKVDAEEAKKNAVRQKKQSLKIAYESNKELVDKMHHKTELAFKPLSVAEFNSASASTGDAISLHKSKSYNGRQSSEYKLIMVNGEPAYARKSNHWGRFSTNIKVGDHDAPPGEEGDQFGRVGYRSFNWSLEGDGGGKTSRAGYVLLKDVAGTGASTPAAPMAKSTTDTILFFKSLVGPYLRGGKIVNVSGYHGRQARAQAHDGQMSLFGGPTSGKPLGPSPLNGKDAVAHTPDMFEEPQHTEPTRELIAEHERLVDVLNSPSHADDKSEAKKQAAELAEMKGEVDEHDHLLADIPGAKWRRGKGLIAGHYAVEVDGETQGNFHAKPEDAVSEAKQWMANAKASKDEADRKTEAVGKMRDRLLSGGEVTDADLALLGLRDGSSGLKWFIPAAANVFGISSRAVRPYIADQIRVGHTDMGSKLEFVSPKKALQAIAAAIKPQPMTKSIVFVRRPAS